MQSTCRYRQALNPPTLPAFSSRNNPAQIIYHPAPAPEMVSDDEGPENVRFSVAKDDALKQVQDELNHIKRYTDVNKGSIILNMMVYNVVLIQCNIL